MKNWLHKIYLNRHFLLFIMLFSYVQSIFIRISAKEEINKYTFTPEAVLFTVFQAGVLFVVIHFFIRIWQKSEVFSTKELLKIFALSLITYLVFLKASGLIVAFLFDTVVRNFNKNTFFFTMFADFLNGFIYGSFFIAYYYYKKSNNHLQQLTNYHQALSESRIHQMKSQLNPHFLFNNLNLLDQLIEEDKQKASDFLNEFAEIYRYVLQASEKKAIKLENELEFATRYFKIIQHKYGNAYQLMIEGKNKYAYIVPLTLQLLIENAVQHNLGTKEKPILINITVNENICITNNIHRKRNPKPTHGKGLTNLTEQYKLLAAMPLEINQSESSFSVSIPTINQKKYDKF